MACGAPVDNAVLAQVYVQSLPSPAYDVLRTIGLHQIERVSGMSFEACVESLLQVAYTEDRKFIRHLVDSWAPETENDAPLKAQAWIASRSL